MDRIITIDGKEVRMRASALVPRLYRFRFGRDLIQDMNRLQKKLKKASELTADSTEDEIEDAKLSAIDLTIFENVAYILAKHGDPEQVPDSIEDWMDQFNTFSIYEVFPEILDLWAGTNLTTAIPKKK